MSETQDKVDTEREKSEANSNANNYVDFNQFLLQHQLTGQMADSLPRNFFDYYTSPVPFTPLSNFSYDGFEEANAYRSDLVSSSNLVPTAAEFIPRFNNLSLVQPNLAFAPVIRENREANGTEAVLNTEQEGTITIPNRYHSATGAISKSQEQKHRNRNKDFEGPGRAEGRYTQNGAHSSRYKYHQENGYYNNRNKQNYENISKKRENAWRNNRESFENKTSDRRDNSDSDGSLEKQRYNKSSNSLKGSSSHTFDEEKSNEKLSQREKLIREIEARKLECLVCVEQIKGHQSVWSCYNCFHILHLSCVIKWACSSKSDEGWRCPACQNTTKTVPKDYYCFCGTVKNPQYNRNDVAHSCGEVCGRKDHCQHPCTLLCHPGPCPLCQAIVSRNCGCGKISREMQCSFKEDLFCGDVCEKLLNCELHTCESKCHQGKCPSCTHKVTQNCHCDKTERQVFCTRDSNEKKNFSCGKPCAKPLGCGSHKCKDVCHTGECKPCKLSPEVVRSCPCGKMLIAAGDRKSCLDPIPQCDGICGRVLKCGPPAFPHNCVSKCHLGNCPPCNKQTAVKCRCGHMDQMIKCRQLSSRADDARCKKRCTKKRSCGRHKCNQECCIDIDHICPLTCNYNLSCGKHKCDQPCHRGNCPPCYRSSFDELYCECGANVIYPPVPCGTKRPPCEKPCSRQHPCEHPVQHNCHSATTCPPCIIFTTKYCYKRHEQRKTIPCNQTSFSCGLPCGEELTCGRHKCIKPCHDGSCQAEGDICKQQCKKSRASCGHKCNALCHDGACPETPCREMVEVTCDCGHRKQQRSCHDFSSEFRRIATAQLASSMQEMQRGNLVELSDIMGPVKMTTNKTLECNQECKVVERNRRLAVALQSPDVPSSKILTRYSDYIKNWAKKDPQLVKMIHEALSKLVKLAKESPQKSRSHSFPTMNREKRSLVHEMCSMFGVQSVAYDAEPNRNVIATAYKDKCWLPAMSIMEVMQRDSGQRRVPVPTNNVWGLKR